MDRRPQLEGANIVRFVAAMMIVTFHVAGMTKLAMPDQLAFVVGYGGLGVPLFYTLSAFALCYGYFGKLETADQISRFYSRRFWRIAPLFYTMMLFYIGYFWVVHSTSVSIANVVTSATFTFNLVPQNVTGFVFASWSIGVEMLFYAIFPLLILLISNLTRAVLAFAFAVFIVAMWTSAFASAEGTLQQFGTYSLVAFLHYFAAGILAFFIWRTIRWTPNRHRIVTAFAAIMIVALMIFPAQIHFALGSIFGFEYGTATTKAVWAAAFIVLILGLSFERTSVPLLKIPSKLGEASFSLYLLHPAIISILVDFGTYEWLYEVMPGDGAGFFASLAVTLAALFPLSMITFEHIERRFYSGSGRAVLVT